VQAFAIDVAVYDFKRAGVRSASADANERLPIRRVFLSLPNLEDRTQFARSLPVTFRTRAKSRFAAAPPTLPSASRTISRVSGGREMLGA